MNGNTHNMCTLGPKMVCIASSQMICRLSLGSCRSYFLMCCHILLTHSGRDSFDPGQHAKIRTIHCRSTCCSPTRLASASLNISGLLNALLGLAFRFFFSGLPAASSSEL